MSRKDWSPPRPPRPQEVEEIISSIARTFWVTWWADREEERGRRFPPGTELFEVAPRTPRAALEEAGKFIHEMEKANRMPLAAMYARAVRAAGEEDVADLFGYYTAMQAMGSGVAWTDDYPDHGLEIPYHESFWF